MPLLLFSSARADVAFTPLNYRLSSDGLRELIERLPQPLVVVPAPAPGLTIVYDDHDLVVVDKPVGVAAHPSVGGKIGGTVTRRSDLPRRKNSRRPSLLMTITS